MRPGQMNFSLTVAVCAWCEPHPPAGEIGALSHGICLRHLRQLKLQSQGLLPKHRRRSRRESAPELQLPL